MKKGFTLVEIMIVVAIIGIIIAIAVPAFLRARENARGRACQENLSKIDGAVQQYAIEHKVGAAASVEMTDLVLADGTGYLKTTPVCPSDESNYVMGTTINDDPTCPNGTATTDYTPHVLPSAGAAN